MQRDATEELPSLGLSTACQEPSQGLRDTWSVCCLYWVKVEEANLHSANQISERVSRVYLDLHRPRRRQSALQPRHHGRELLRAAAPQRVPVARQQTQLGLRLRGLHACKHA